MACWSAGKVSLEPTSRHGRPRIVMDRSEQKRADARLSRAWRYAPVVRRGGDDRWAPMSEVAEAARLHFGVCGKRSIIWAGLTLRVIGRGPGNATYFVREAIPGMFEAIGRVRDVMSRAYEEHMRRSASEVIARARARSTARSMTARPVAMTDRMRRYLSVRLGFFRLAYTHRGSGRRIIMWDGPEYRAAMESLRLPLSGAPVLRCEPSGEDGVYVADGRGECVRPSSIWRSDKDRSLVALEAAISGDLVHAYDTTIRTGSPMRLIRRGAVRRVWSNVVRTRRTIMTAGRVMRKRAVVEGK
jgi:hypothetical protein